MIFTKSSFIYGHTINETNSFLDFQEGVSPIISMQLNVGEYTLTDFVNTLATSLNDNGTLNYTVSVNRVTRIITISADGNFKLLASTGPNVGRGVWSLLGFNNVDTILATSHVGSLASGSLFEPQFYLQDYVDFEDQQSAIDGVTKQSTSGKIETVSFGKKKIMDCNVKYITDVAQNSELISSDTSAVSKARQFLEYITTKADIEFIKDKTKPDVYIKCILESTPENQDGLGFKLKEMYSSGLVGYYETGLIKFRRL